MQKRATKKVALTIAYSRFSIKIRSATPDFQCFFNRNKVNLFYGFKHPIGTTYTPSVRR